MRRGGNSIGGVIYTWLDSWWLCGSSFRHDGKNCGMQGAIKDGWFNDEWFGICSQGNGKKSPFLRQLKKVYYLYQNMWNN
ncbi:MAG: hypothetical protein ABH858_05310 [Candidatus Omnitrophota bacterium]